MDKQKLSKNNRWEYGGSIERYPIKPGEIWEQNGCQVCLNDLMNGLPPFMRSADVVFIDPPWNQGNANSFITKAGNNNYLDDFKPFYNAVFRRIDQISPRICYIEIGKEYLADFVKKLQNRYKYVTVYNSSYYHKPENVCYVVRGSNKAKKPKLDGMDEEDIIQWVCENEEYNVIGDFVIGRGLVGKYAWQAGRKFVGCELNPARLAVLLERIGGNWNVIPPAVKKKPGRRPISEEDKRIQVNLYFSKEEIDRLRRKHAGVGPFSRWLREVTLRVLEH